MLSSRNVRAYIFEREQGICRCCRIRATESMHELRFRSLGGKVSRFNSVALCGDGTRGCHGFLQRLEIEWLSETPHLGADWLLQFRPKTAQASEWMRVPTDLWVCSMPGSRNDELEAC